MKNFTSTINAALILLLVSGCSTVPPTNIKTPLSARPDQMAQVVPHNGAIFQPGKNDHPWFEDKRPRRVGDILTVNLVETISTSTSSTNSRNHSGNTSTSTPTISRGVVTPGSTSSASTLLNPYNISNSSAASLSDQSTDTGANSFTGTVTVTVIDVYPNGNLLVGGEKQITVDQEAKYIRISGVVDPMMLTGDTIQSTQLSDVHLEYKAADSVDSTNVLGSVQRFFRTMLPF
jgi:flagellar L-ring protein precursor FlgH